MIKSRYDYVLNDNNSIFPAGQPLFIDLDSSKSYGSVIITYRQVHGCDGLLEISY